MPALSARSDEPFSAQVKGRKVRTDHRTVDFVHACAFCGWSRSSDSAVVLPAGCPECGCAVDSRDAHAATPAAAPTSSRSSDARVLRVTIWVFGAALLYTAARAGHSVAGLSGAITAVGIAGFLLLPFVPERLPAR
jgi:hypothetical protein